MYCSHRWMKHGAERISTVIAKKSPHGANSHNRGRNLRIKQVLFSGLIGSPCHQNEPNTQIAALPIHPYSGGRIFFGGFSPGSWNLSGKFIWFYWRFRIALTPSSQDTICPGVMHHMGTLFTFEDKA